MKTKKGISTLWTSILVAMGIVGMTVGVAEAGLWALDDFSSGDNNGGFGWTGAWSTTPSFSSTSPFPDNPLSDMYLSDGIGSTTRSLATPLLPETTPEVWIGIYLRPVNMGGWQFGFEVLNSTGNGGAQAGSMSGAAGGSRKLARANAENQVGSGNAFTLNQSTLLVMRIYKNNPADTVYNRADLYTDLDGADGRYNSEVAVATGLDLSNRSAANISRIKLHTDTTIQFDYVAVGTTKESVTTHPWPSTPGTLIYGK